MVHVGVIGCGHWGSKLIRAFQEDRRSDVTAVCDTEISRLNVIRGRYPVVATHTDWQELIARGDVTLVVVATPLDSHYAIAKEAIRHGKHVLVETPFTRDAEQAEELVELADREGVSLAVDFNSVLTPEIQFVREMIDSGALGELSFLDTLRTSVGSIERQADVMLDLASHELAMIEFLTGRAAKSVLATGSSHAEDGQVDVAFINRIYGDGLMANVRVNRLVPVPSRRLMIGGTRRTIVMDDLFADERLRIYEGESCDAEKEAYGSTHQTPLSMNRQGKVVIPRFSSTDALAALARHVVSAITDGTPLIVDGHLGRNVMRIIESCGRSLFEDAGQVLKENSAPASSVLMTASKEAAGITPASTGEMSAVARNSIVVEPEAITRTALMP